MPKLPVGKTEFDALIDEVLAHPDCPTKDKDSVIFAVAAQIMHGGPAHDTYEINDLIAHLRAGAAKQVAHAAFVDVKTRQQAAAKAAEEAAKNDSQ